MSKHANANKQFNTADIKLQICEICQRMYNLGWVAANDGNVSVKLSDDCVLATPTGISKSLVNVSNIVKFNPENPGEYQGKASSEINMHLRCYKERADITAVIHAHPPCATAFAIAGKPLDDYSMTEAVLSLGSVPVTPYAAPSTEQVGDSIAPYLQIHDVLLLENHGAVAVGIDLLTAFNRMETLELWAKTLINARLLGGTKEIKNIDELCSLREKYKITGRHPGYKKYSID
jgi:L-fuculose-phosphate aldolase